MGSMSAQTGKIPVQLFLAAGGVYVCVCKRNEFRVSVSSTPTHYFCRCGRVYTSKDLPPLKA